MKKSQVRLQEQEKEMKAEIAKLYDMNDDLKAKANDSINLEKKVFTS